MSTTKLQSRPNKNDIKNNQDVSSSSSSDICFQMPSLFKQTESSKQKSKKQQPQISNPPKSKPLSRSKSSNKTSKFTNDLVHQARNIEGKRQITEIDDMYKKIKAYSKKIKTLKNQLKEDENLLNQNQSVSQNNLNNSLENQQIIQKLELTIHQLKNNEIHLLEELQKQSDISKEALNKLYQYQQDTIVERERIKKYYEDYFQRKGEETERKYEQRMMVLEQEIFLLRQQVQEANDFRGKEKSYLREIDQLKDQVQENSRLKYSNVVVFENQELRRQMDEQEKRFKQELIEMEQKAELWEQDINKLQKAQKLNDELVLKVHTLEKKLKQRKEQEAAMKKEWQKQYDELISEIKYLKTEMDRVLKENENVIAKLSPKKKKFMD